MWILAIPVMLSCLVVAIAMRGWAFRTLASISTRGLVGTKYSGLNPDGFVFWFDAKLLLLVFGRGAEVVSPSERFWLSFYVASRVIGVSASLILGFGQLQSV
jgi:hypothetical protein